MSSDDIGQIFSDQVRQRLTELREKRGIYRPVVIANKHHDSNRDKLKKDNENLLLEQNGNHTEIKNKFRHIVHTVIDSNRCDDDDDDVHDKEYDDSEVKDLMNNNDIYSNKNKKHVSNSSQTAATSYVLPKKKKSVLWNRMYSIAEIVANDLLHTKPIVVRTDDDNIVQKFDDFEIKVRGKLKDTVHQYFQKNAKTSDVNRRLKSQIWSSVVTLVLVEGKNLPTVDPETGSCDSYVKFRLGNEKYKSRVFWRSTTPRWLEQFDLHLYDDGDQQLEVTVWDKERSRDDYIGRCVIDLSSMEREVTHGFWQDLEEGEGSLYFLLTISGTTASETISDLSTYEENPTDKIGIENRYIWHQSFNNIKDVGHLTVKVFRATGLAAADLGGKSDPFCVLELGNARLQTQTEYKTLSPCWNKIFTFNVKDINNTLEVTVFDEDRDHKVEFLGKLAIPLLRIRNDERRWYPLKDKKLRSRAKGANPQILLEMTVNWNPIRACIRTLNPKEEKYMQPEVKFKRQVFVRNVLRLKAVAMHFIELGKLLNGCFEWESTLRSFLALLLWLVLCYYFEPWMVPAFGLLYFLKQYLVKSLTGGGPSLPAGDQDDSDIDDDEDDDKDKEEKKSLKERLQAIQEVTQSVQNYIGYIASLGESVKNIFNFTVPFLSWIAIGLLVAASIVLYFIPIRYLLMLWGANKFARRLLRPHCVPNNEVLDLLSRVPDDEMLLDFRELKALPGPEQPDRRKEHRKKHKVS